ncbi:MAG: hypothetical protein JOY80_04995 [Candidatus Dormibacteraeota bacterium]|nr:hypothetical protein [Candidatus Dormibacteraeota bacterium]
MSEDVIAATMRGEPDQTIEPPLSDMYTAARDLAAALRGGGEGGGEHADDELQHEVLRRARAILESPEDGSEVSDVAWPYFVLPDVVGYGVPHRRLLGAALTAWPAPPPSLEGWGGYDTWPPDPLLAAARQAVMASVNSFDRREPVK